MDLLNQRMRLEDGRTLGFAEYGSPAGSPVVYLHGWPSSRLEPFAMSERCAEMGVRLIAPDRPGLGLSDFKAKRAIGDFVGDVTELANHLKLGRFGVLGISGGGPYAAACAGLLGERLSAVVLVCSVGPVDAPDATKGMVAINRWLLNTARRFPRLAEWIGGLCLRAIWRKGNQAIPRQIEQRLPPSDRKALDFMALRQALTNASVEALRQGVRGAAADGLLYGRPWGFSLEAIRVPVFVWHGEADVVVPSTMGRYLAKTIPGCQSNFFEEDGHFSLPYFRLGEILKPFVRQV